MLFYGLAVFTGTLAIAAVFTKNILRATVWLMGVLTGTAGLYLVLGAEFLAGVQVLIYVGGVVVLLVFAVMLTRSDDLMEDHPSLGKKLLGLTVSGVFFISSLILMASSVFRGTRRPHMASVAAAALGRKLLDTGAHGYVLPFEILSLLLLAVLIGGIVIAKENKQRK